MSIDDFDSTSATATQPDQDAVALARKIRMWQEAQRPKLSDAALLQRFPALGSTKTYAKLRGGDTAQLDLPDWSLRYLGVWTHIETESNNAEEPVYEDLTCAQHVASAVLRLVHSKGLNRLVMIEGGTGVGKTESLRLVMRRIPGAAVYVEADESWARPAVAAGALCMATGAVSQRSALPGRLADRIDLLVDRLKSRRVILIDEGHHMSGQTLNLLKSLINRTPSVFAVAALDTLWRKLQANAWQEAKQLVMNRLFDRVRLTGPTSNDTKLFFERRLPLDKDAPAAFKDLATAALTCGGMAFLRSIAERCQSFGEGAIDAASLRQAAAAVKAMIDGRQ